MGLLLDSENRSVNAGLTNLEETQRKNKRTKQNILRGECKEVECLSFCLPDCFLPKKQKTKKHNPEGEMNGDDLPELFVCQIVAFLLVLHDVAALQKRRHRAAPSVIKTNG